MGVTLAIFSFEGTIPDDKDELKMWVRGILISKIGAYSVCTRAIGVVNFGRELDNFLN